MPTTHYSFRVSAQSPGFLDQVAITAPYLYSLSSGAGWTDGDRWGYSRCYGYLREVISNPQSPFIFRFSADANINEPGGIAYATINDIGMTEGNYAFDGSPCPGAQQCGQPGDMPFEGGYPTLFAGPLPKIEVVRTSDNVVLETRNYDPPLTQNPRTIIEPGHTARIFEASERQMLPGDNPNGFGTLITPNVPLHCNHVTVLLFQGDTPVASVYYDVPPSEYPRIFLRTNMPSATQSGVLFFPVSDSQGNTTNASVQLEVG